MSAKNIVNPDHYKLAGRDRPNEVILPGLEKQKMAAESRHTWDRRTRRRWPFGGKAAAATNQAGPAAEAEESASVAGKRGARKAAGSRTRKPGGKAVPGTAAVRRGSAAAKARARAAGAAARRRTGAVTKTRRSGAAAARRRAGSTSAKRRPGSQAKRRRR